VFLCETLCATLWLKPLKDNHKGHQGRHKGAPRIIKMTINQFNIRVYGIMIDDGKVLVSDEFRLGIFMTKFPGGALNFGEGIKECLHREFMEELNTEIDIISHYYTTDFFQPTNLLPFTFQLINVYYLVKTAKPYHFLVSDRKYDFNEVRDGAQSFRWLAINELSEEDFTLPIDKKVAVMLKNGFTPPDMIKLTD
jgi:8-oxo-dGTP diphosphatase